MMISEKLAEAMSVQVGREMAASNQYLVIATYFEREMLDQLAGFFYRQAAEEHEHAMKFVHYVTGAGGKVVLPAVEAPRPDIASAESAAKLSVDWENEVTRQIHGLMDQAVKENDYLAQDFLRRRGATGENRLPVAWWLRSRFASCPGHRPTASFPWSRPKRWSVGRECRWLRSGVPAVT